MERFFEFVGKHWILSTLWIVLLAALILYQKSKSGKSVTAQEATLLINRQDGVIVDIRDKKEFDKGHIAGAVNLPLDKLGQRLKQLEKYREKPVVVVCNMGHQSGEAVKTLQQAGFSQVSRMTGGMSEWRSQSLPLVT